jgi:preprotein translocase subunit Sec61beta
MGKDSVSMPMASAGIIGFSPDIKISGMEVDPKVVLIAVFAVVIIVHVANYVVH